MWRPSKVSELVVSRARCALLGTCGGAPDERVAEVLEAIASGLRAGRPLDEILDDAGRAVGGVLGDDAMTAAARLRGGVPIREVLRRWSEVRAGSGLELGLAVLEVGIEVGGHRAAALDAVAKTLRDRRAAELEVRVHSTQARLSALVTCTVPLLFGFVSFLAVPGALHGALGTLAGRCALGIALVLEWVGVVWTRRIIREAVG
ncbi:MAG: hypothetical protein KatS3mg008_1531 [Acidimicrobiales bacterium]|nr:MAG: hypothetical protein KatS3mg008_1531 [Acidimicrobiales bacterium]